MTSPGYPDYQAVANALSNNIFPALNQVLPNGHTTTPVVPVSNWQSLFLRVTSSAGQAIATVAFWEDLAGTLGIGTVTYRINPGSAIAAIIPLRAQYFSIDIQVTSAGSMTCTTHAAFMSRQVDQIRFPVTCPFVNDSAHSLAASTTIDYQVASIVAGRAQLMFNPADATGKLIVTVNACDQAGNIIYPVAEFGGPTGPLNTMLVVPDESLKLHIFNSDGAGPHVYDTSLTVVPG